MSEFARLRRLAPFEGLCLTSQDLLDEQTYHRRCLQRHNLFLHGYGIVQGLQVELEQRRKSYYATVQAGFGITRMGQGVHLPEPAEIKLEVPQSDGEYLLWLFHTEAPAEDSQRPVFDSSETRPARIVEGCAARLHPAGEEQPDAVALCRINVRMGRLIQVRRPVPRAGRTDRAAESYLKPQVEEFIRLSRKMLQDLLRAALVQELGLPAVLFGSALVSSEFLLIEEGTSDRVLYRTAGQLIAYAHDYLVSLPKTTARIAKFTEFVKRVNAELPGRDQGDEVWLRWFEKFERLLPHLQKICEELEKTAAPRR